MAWIERRSDERLDPAKYYPGVKSIISLSVNYYSSDYDIIPSDGEGQVSRYAVGVDYHFVIPGMLKGLLEYIKVLDPKAEGVCVIDTSPVMDKIWAAKSGIGWIGKHSNVITKEFGSYVFLGEILLNIEFDPDKAIENFCGSCTKCIDACPTQAITEPYVVDSNKCISYRTIEHKGDFPEDWKSENGDWIYGCDICQEVCPWNKFKKETTIPEFLPRDDNRILSLEWLMKMNDDEFRARFSRSPLKRTKLHGIKRNVESVFEYITKKNI